MTSDKKVAFITGAARPWGLGRASAVGLAKRGMDIVVADIREDWGEEAVKAIKDETGRNAIYVETDVSKLASIEAAVDRTMRDMGRIDVLANIAGVVSFHPVGQITEEAFDRMININLRGVMFLCQAVVPHMRNQGGGRIVIVASRSGWQPRAGLGIYGASKAGVVSFGKALAAEVAQDEIIVVTVAPGYMVTSMGQQGGPSPEDFEAPGTGSPFGRGLRPEEVADVVIYAATSKSHALSGQVLHANGADYMV